MCNRKFGLVIRDIFAVSDLIALSREEMCGANKQQQVRALLSQLNLESFLLNDLGLCSTDLLLTSCAVKITKDHQLLNFKSILKYFSFFVT